MFRFIPNILKGVFSTLLYATNTVLLCIPIIVIALFKFVLPFSSIQRILTKPILWCAETWILNNSIIAQQFNRLDTHITGNFKLDSSDNSKCSYLVLANHQSAIDIIIMQFIFRKKIPFLRFFLKQELIYVPFLGLAWWALDFPFMKRFKKSQIKKNPHLKGKDVEATRKACEKFKEIPISMVNYVEGTRFSKEKSLIQGQQYQHLLRPRAGGAGYVMSLLGDQITHVLDITIHYPDSSGTYWEFATGKMKNINIHIQSIQVTEELQGNYIDDPRFKAFFQKWLAALWQEKDARLESFNRRTDNLEH